MTAKETSVNTPLRPIALRRACFVVRDIGESLIIGRMPESAKRQMRDKQFGKPAKSRQPKDPNQLFLDTLTFVGPTPKNYAEWEAHPHKWSYGIAAEGVKKAIVSAADYVDVGMKPYLVRGSFFIPGRFVKIRGTPTIREDFVNNAGINRSADIRFRPEFKPPWSLIIPIVIHHDALTLEHITALLSRAGVSIGVGAWRVQRSGQHGMFEVLIPGAARRAPLDEKWWDDKATSSTILATAGPTEPKRASGASTRPSQARASKKPAARSRKAATDA